MQKKFISLNQNENGMRCFVTKQLTREEHIAPNMGFCILGIDPVICQLQDEHTMS